MSRGEILEQKTDAYIDGVWYTIARNTMTYNPQGKRITSENLAGQVTTTAWDCCFAYGYNNRSELTNAVAAVDSDYRYAYDFDDIGNRESSFERGTNSLYTANQLNQYTEISSSALSASPRETFTPQFDDDGNQTLIKTSTGIWSVTYNGENRPILWTCIQSYNQTITNSQTISMSYDRMGRRVAKNNQRFVYDGYLQIANFEQSATNSQLTTYNPQLFLWDPTEPVATRPLAWDQDGTLSYYVFDGDKNVCDVIAKEVAIVVHYEYALFGLPMAVSDEQTCSNPWCFSAEYLDAELMQYYYNYRCLDPGTGRWISVDPILDEVGVNGYAFCMNNPIGIYDIQGLISPAVPMSGIFAISAWVLKLGMPYLGVDGIIQIKGRRAGVFCEIVGRMSARSFVDSVARFDDCSIELIEFRGHGDNGFMIPFVNVAFSSAQEESIISDNTLHQVSIVAKNEIYDLSQILGKKMRKDGLVFFNGCNTADHTKETNIARELSIGMKDVKVMGNGFCAADLRVLLAFSGVTYRPWCPSIKVYVNGKELPDYGFFMIEQSLLPFSEGNPYSYPVYPDLVFHSYGGGGRVSLLPLMQ